MTKDIIRLPGKKLVFLVYVCYRIISVLPINWQTKKFQFWVRFSPYTFVVVDWDIQVCSKVPMQKGNVEPNINPLNWQCQNWLYRKYCIFVLVLVIVFVFDIRFRKWRSVALVAAGRSGSIIWHSVWVHRFLPHTDYNLKYFIFCWL